MVVCCCEPRTRPPPPPHAIWRPMASLSPLEVALLYAIFCALCREVESVALGLMQGLPIPKRIPLGSIFDEDTVSRTAFRYELEKHNNSTTSFFKLDRYDKMIDGREEKELVKAMCSTMHKGVFAFFGVTNSSSLQRTANTFARRFQMPYVTVSAPSYDWDPSRHAFTLFLRPEYHKAVLNIVQHYQWPKVYYIYNTNDGLSRVEFMHSVLNRDEFTVDIDVMRIQMDQCHVSLRQLDARDTNPGDKFIILDIFPQPTLQSVLRQIQNVGMNRANYHYVLAGLEMDELDLEDFRHGGANVTGFRLLRSESPTTREAEREWQKLNPRFGVGAGQGRKIPLDAALSIDAVRTISKGLNAMMDRAPDAFRSVFRRGQFYNNNERGIECKTDSPNTWQHGADIFDSLKSVNFSGVSGEVAFDNTGHRRNYTFEILTQRVDSDPVRIGFWSQNANLRVDSQTEPNATKDEPFVNRTRIVTTILSDPYIMMRKLKAEEKHIKLTGNDIFEGFCADLAKKIAKEVGFDYIIRLVKDEKYGEKMPDGNWNGMVGELSRKEADIAIAPLTISSMRERVIDFSKPFMNLGISIMIKKPEKQKPGVFSFMDPLSYEIWMCIVVSYLAVSIVLFVVSRFSPNEWQIEDSSQGPAFVNDFTILNSLWFSLGAFMRRGCEVCPRSLAGRIVGSAWWFFTLIIISSYTANLAAFLTIERMMTPIESADDLAKQTEILYGTLDAGSTKEFFRTSKIQVYEKMWSFMNNDPSVFVRTTDDGVRRVRTSKGKYAFLLESTMNDYHNQRKPCNTMKVGDNLDSKGYGIATYIGSDLRERINVAVLQLLEREELQKLQKRWWYDKGECVIETEAKSGSSSQTSLSLSNVAGIFYILIGGLGLAMIVGSFEFLYKSRIEARRNRYGYNAPCNTDNAADAGKSHTQV